MTMQQNLDSLLVQTKLNRPGVTKDLVIRHRLGEQLNAGVEGPLTLVVAPAGFGKTTLVSAWLQERNGQNDKPIPAAWLTLDEGDRDPVFLLRYFIGALRTIFPDACPETINLINANREPPVSLLSDMLINEIELLPSPFIIVLDDFFTIRERSVLTFIDDFVRHWPSRMHMIILSRYNPSLPLAGLRAHGLLTEIRARDLRFLPDEITEYFSLALGGAPDETALSLIQGQLEGWIAGMKMIALSMGGRYAPQAIHSALQDGDTYLTDYLMNEVIGVQSPAIQRFLLVISIVDRFCASLCAALVSGFDVDCDPHTCLDYIETTDLFVTPLDTQQEWYRFHRMFRDLLRQRLSRSLNSAQVHALHSRAAAWFAANDLPDEAIHHALEAGDHELAANFMKIGLCDLLNREDRPTMERWLRLMPEVFIQRSHELLILRAWTHAIRWEYENMMPVIAQAESLLNRLEQQAQSPSLRGQIAALKGHYAYYFNHYDQAVAYCQNSLALMPEDWRYVRGVAWTYLGLSLYATGRATDAEKLLTEQYESSSRTKIDGPTLRLLLALAINAIQAGNYEIAERTAKTLLRQATEIRFPMLQSWGHYLLGFINYEWNVTELAARQFSEGVDASFGINLLIARNAMIGQALTSQALGHSADALENLNTLSRIDLDIHGVEGVDTASARARLMLVDGDLEAAERWADLFNAPPAEQSLIVLMEQSQLTKARILISRNRGRDIETAMEILDKVGEVAGSSFNIRITIKVLALRSLAQLTRGQTARARETLIQAVELARRGVFTRTFVDLGPQMQKLLQQIAGHGPTAKTASRILAAFDASEITRGPTSLYVRQKNVYQPDDADGSLDESLTPRELEVLKLLTEPIGLKVIAERMGISYATARRYTISIYGKFGVHSRWEAVDLGVRKGIISPQ